jgi:3-oxoacyl-[acyl-carrier-protein] synthase-3
MKLTDRMAIEAVHAWLPHQRTLTASVVADGGLESQQAEVLATRSLAVSSDGAGPEFAVRAAGPALAAAGRDPSSIGVLAHAWINHQGHDFWSPAHYVAREVGAVNAVPFGVQQMCNGGAVALATAAASLLADPRAGAALVTTGDQFRRPGFDRWAGDYGVMYGDAGTALVLRAGTRPDDAFHLLSLVTLAAPDLEEVHRGDDPFTDVPRGRGPVIDVRRSKKAFLSRYGSDMLVRRTVACVDRLLDQALDDAGLAGGAEEVQVVALPRLGAAALDSSYRPALGRLGAARSLDLGRTTGHLGAGDLAANLHALAAAGEIDPGRVAVVISGGGGFTWSAVVVRRPETSQSHRGEPMPISSRTSEPISEPTSEATGPRTLDGGRS